MNALHRLNCIDLKYGKVSSPLSHYINLFYIIKHEHPQEFIHSEAMHVLLNYNTCSVFIFGNESRKWQNIFVQADKLIKQPDWRYRTRHLESTEDLIRCLYDNLHTRGIVPADYYLIYDDEELCLDILNYYKDFTNGIAIMRLPRPYEKFLYNDARSSARNGLIFFNDLMYLVEKLRSVCENSTISQETVMCIYSFNALSAVEIAALPEEMQNHALYVSNITKTCKKELIDDLNPSRPLTKEQRKRLREYVNLLQKTIDTLNAFATRK